MAKRRRPPLEASLGVPSPAVDRATETEPATNRFTAAWALALTAIGVLAVGSTLLVGSTLDLQREAAAVGRRVADQRTTANRIEEGAWRLQTAPDQASAAVVVDDMQTALANLESTHRLLTEGAPDLDIPAPSVTDTLMGAELLRSSEADVVRIVSELGQVVAALPADAAPDEVSAQVDDLADELKAAENEYARNLDTFAGDYDLEAGTRVEQARSIDRSMLLATLALLVIEALLVFRPATRRMREVLEVRRRQTEDERARTKQQLETLARYDHLTGLANRMMFRDRLDHAVNAAERSGKRVALMYLDLDKFKDVNDQLGHDAGDELLIEVAERLQGVARRADTIARLGGDEFTVILEGLDSPDGAATVADKLLEIMEVPVDLAGRQVTVTTSIGIAVYPDDADNVEDLLRHADSAMYQAKGAGRNTFQFSTPELREANVKRLRTIAELRTAIAKQRLRLVYQPQISVKTGELVGVEALVRWIQPDGSEVPASEFIELAEDTDLMAPLGDWVLEEACRQNVEWQRLGLPPLRMAINLSSRQFRQLNLATAIATTLNETGMDASLLELEVTEGSLVEDIDTSSATLRLLKGIGVRLAIDDFGTGYSSLSYLKKFPIDSLKIDGSFLEDLGPESSEDAAIPAAIVGLARHLGMEAAAEGVESESQLAFLRRVGCDRAQGYHVSRPLEPHQLVEFARRPRLRSVEPTPISSRDLGSA